MRDSPSELPASGLSHAAHGWHERSRRHVQAPERGRANRCPAPLVPEAIERLLKHYLAGRNPEENLRSWFARHTNDELRAQLAGEILAGVERDLPTGRVPHGMAD